MKCIEHRESQEEYRQTKMQILAQLVSVESEVDNGKSKRGRAPRARADRRSNCAVQINREAMRTVSGRQCLARRSYEHETWDFAAITSHFSIE